MSSPRFLFYINRDVLNKGDEAPEELHINGNIQELKQMAKMINDAIGYSAEGGGSAYCDDCIDDLYVCITAYPDGKAIRKPRQDINPFEPYGSM